MITLFCYIVVSPAMKLLCRYVGFTISFVFQNMNALKPNGFISSKMWFWNVACRWMIQSIRLQYQGVQFPQYTNCLQEKLDKLQEETYLMICFSSVMLYFVNCYHWHKYLSAIKSKVDSSFSHTPHIELVGFDEIIVAYIGGQWFASRSVAMNEACSWHIKPLFQWIVNDNAPHAIKECYTFQTPEKNISIEHLSHLGASMESSLSRRGLEMFLVGARLSFSSVIVRRNKYT